MSELANTKKMKPLNKYLSDVGDLAFGCMGLGGGWDQNPVADNEIKQAHQVIDTALESGINLFDHADIYTFGKAEKAFGHVLAERPELRQKMYIQSKCIYNQNVAFAFRMKVDQSVTIFQNNG